MKIWLNSLGLGQYYDQLQAAGFTSLARCSGLSLQSLDSVNFNLPGHKKRLFREGKISHIIDTQCVQRVMPIGLIVTLCKLSFRNKGAHLIFFKKTYLDRSTIIFSGERGLHSRLEFIRDNLNYNLRKTILTI